MSKLYLNLPKESAALDDIIQYIRQFPLGITIVKLAQLSCSIEKIPGYNAAAEIIFERSGGLAKRKIWVTQKALSFISCQTILQDSDDWSALPSSNDLLLLANWYLNLEEKFIGKKSGYGILIRMSQEQLHFQEIGKYHFARGYFLMSEMSKKNGYKKPLDLEKLFLEWFGLAIEEYYWLFWGIYSAAINDGPLFSKKYFLTGDIQELKDVLTEEKINKFLSRTSATAEEIIKKYYDLKGKHPDNYPESLEKYHFNILTRYPILRLSSVDRQRFGGYDFCITNTKMILTKIVDGAYWELRDMFEAKPGNDGGFIRFWGEIFEKYVGEILEGYYGKRFLCRLDENWGVGKIADWMVVSNTVILLFECKSALLPVHVKGFFDEAKVKEWCEAKGHFVIGVEQLVATKNLLKDKKIPGVKNEDVQNKTVKMILVTYESLYLAPIWEKFLAQIITEKNYFPDQSWCNDFHIMSILELEAFEKIAAKVDLGKMLADVRSNKAEDFLTYGKKIYGGYLTNDRLHGISEKFWGKIT